MAWVDDYITLLAVWLIMQDSDTDSDSDSDFDTDSDEEDEYETLLTLLALRRRHGIGMAPNRVGVIATEPKTKTIRGKVHHFCIHHNKGKGAWVIHHPTKCKNLSHKPEEPKTEQQGVKRSLAMAFQAVQDESTDDFSDEE